MIRMHWVCLLVFGFILNWNMALAEDVYVESSGSCGGETPCYSTIQAAINAANSGDTIKLAQGIYAETFVLNSGKQLTTQGGWDAEFKTQTPQATSIRAPVVPNGAIAFQELRIMEIAGPMGNATTANVLSGRTFSSDVGTGLTGTMPNRGGTNFTPTTTDQTIAAGYHDGSGKVEGDADLAAGNIRSGVTIFGVPGSASAPTGDAIVANVLSGKTFSNASSTGLSGTMANNGAGSTITPGTSDQFVAVGYWSSANTVSGDADLAAGNIKKDVQIFEVTGTYPLAGVAKTGQTTCYNAGGGTTDCLNSGSWPGQDAYWESQGVGVSWPSPRFKDNADGTVTDNMTGLIWLQNANCFGAKSWTVALSDCNTLVGNNTQCDLNDGSIAGDWRLPNVKELQSLIAFAYDEPALSNAAGTAKWTTDEDAFSDVQLNIYWSSTTYAHSKSNAWYVDLDYGIADDVSKGNGGFVWPVRGGQ